MKIMAVVILVMALMVTPVSASIEMSDPVSMFRFNFGTDAPDYHKQTRVADATTCKVLSGGDIVTCSVRSSDYINVDVDVSPRLTSFYNTHDDMILINTTAGDVVQKRVSVVVINFMAHYDTQLVPRGLPDFIAYNGSKEDFGGRGVRYWVIFLIVGVSSWLFVKL